MVMTQLQLIVYLIEVAGVVFALGVFVILRRAHNVIVTVYEEHNSPMPYVYNRRAKIIDTPKNQKLKFMLSRQSAPLFDREYFLRTSKNKFRLNLYLDSQGKYHPIAFRKLREEKKADIPVLDVDYKNTSAWTSLALRTNMEKYKKQGAWEKYAPVIVMGGVIVFASVIMIVYGKYYFDGIAQGGQQLSSSVNQLNDVLSKLVGK